MGEEREGVIEVEIRDEEHLDIVFLKTEEDAILTYWLE